ncbi:MAG TPA: hypothetical protein VII72_22450 [Myxococcota bacterium]
MLHWLAGFTVVLTAADHWTTYLCLRGPVAGWHVSELNPLADWLFTTVGLVPGLLIDSTITLAAVGFLLSTALFPRSTKGVCFAVLVASTAWAVLNNLLAIQALGLSPMGAA